MPSIHIVTSGTFLRCYFIFARSLFLIFIVGTFMPSYAEDAGKQLYFEVVENGKQCASGKSGTDRLNCFIKATPKKCQTLVVNYFADNEKDEARRAWFYCVASCAGEGVWSNTFGDCSRERRFVKSRKPEIKSRELSFAEEVVPISGNARLSYGDRFSGELYNGNTSITITQVTIKIETIYSYSGIRLTKEYTVDITILPLTKKYFGIDIETGGSEATYEWSIEQAKGY